MMGELMIAKENGPYHGFLPLKFELLNMYEYVFCLRNGANWINFYLVFQLVLVILDCV